MKLEFRLLIIDDTQGSIDQAIASLKDYLDSQGFTLKFQYADDVTDAGLKNLARDLGRSYDLVAIDYNLGQANADGATAARRMRQGFQFTDIVFYSSDPQAGLLNALAQAGVPGVFVAQRDSDLDDVMKGLAGTIIGKAVDLNHMRGIAMAEVAEMDVLMEEVLERVFMSEDDVFIRKGKETLSKVLAKADENLQRLREMVESGSILKLITNSGIFSSAEKYMAINRVVKCLTQKPIGAIEALKTYEADIIQKRNTLAHAKEEINDDGTVTLRAIRRGNAPIIINDAWMVSFRGKLRDHRGALASVCDALDAQVVIAAAKAKQSKA